jgi:lipid A ethanolaminephosphotransferase
MTDKLRAAPQGAETRSGASPRRRWSLRPEVAVLIVATYFLLFFNTTFWTMLYGGLAPNRLFEWLFLVGIAVCALAIFNLIFGAFALPYLFKPAMTVFLLTAAPAAYFINEYRVAIDGGLLQNIAQTDPGEVRDLLSVKLAAYVVFAGLLPAWLLWRTHISYRSWPREVLVKTVGATISLTLIVGSIFPFMSDVTSVFREHRQLLYYFSPVNSLVALYSYSRKINSHVVVMPYGEDAHKSERWTNRKARSLTVIVVGETARAANFSLNGYARETNPHLAKVPGLVNFPHAYSCGTDTSHSVPCMFSGFGRAQFSIDRAAQREGLLDIIQRAGFSVLWRENQSGCKGVCQRVPTETLVKTHGAKFYEVTDAMDEALLSNLSDKVHSLDRDGVFVLHMMGSHGPAYYKRYPDRFERFRPTCKESQFSRCTNQEIINAYDNSIVYTDYVLYRLIELLQGYDREGIPSSMIYLSDHGESLGEDNLYLHAMPYPIAPDVQKHIPFLLWLSPRYQAEFAVDMNCMQSRKDRPVSQDNLFHSVLGILDIETKAYDAKLDIFAPCRKLE